MSKGFTILGCTTVLLDELQGSGHWIRSQWYFCCVSNHVKYLNLHPFFSVSLTSDQWIMEWFGLQEAWEVIYVSQAGTHCTNVGGSSCSSWAQTCSVTAAPVPASPAGTHRHTGSRGCSPAPVAGTNHHTGHGFLNKQEVTKKGQYMATKRGWRKQLKH